ncbi:unnamed protein product [Prunus brigantina]
MRAEVEKLSTIGFIKEADYPSWLANVVMVRKGTKGWRMCVDYTNLNRACPKDSFPLPRIDQLVDATAGHALLGFMDAYSGYNQIFMHPEDQAHTSFITDRGLYCYKVMPFGLKNAGATYRLLQKPETSGRLVKWAIELGEFDIHYKPRPATKGQAVADFISEFTEPSRGQFTNYDRAYSYIKPDPHRRQRHSRLDSTLVDLVCRWLFQCPGMRSWPRSHLPA